MLDLRDLPSSCSIFVDTNVFYYHFMGRSATCTAFLNRIASGEINGYVNTEVLSDLLHKMMLAEAKSRKFINDPSATQLKSLLQQNRSAIASMPDHQVMFEKILAIGLKVLRISKALLIETKDERRMHGLMTNDSLHLGNMNRHRMSIKNIATRDGDFNHVTEITVWTPMDIV